MILRRRGNDRYQYTPTLKQEGIKQPRDQTGREAAPSLKNAPVAQGIERCPAEAEAARSNRAGRMAQPSHSWRPQSAETNHIRPRTLRLGSAGVDEPSRS